MTQTVYGIAADAHGIAWRHELKQGHDRPELRLRGWLTRTADLRAEHPSDIPVNVEHDPTAVIGNIIHAELRDAGNLWLVAHIDDDVEPLQRVKVAGRVVDVPVTWYWSLETNAAHDGSDIQVTGAALTANPARGIIARPVQFRHGDSHSIAFTTTDRRERRLLTRAAETNRRHRNGQPLRIERERTWADLDATPGSNDDDPGGPMHYGPAMPILAVRR